MSPCPKTSFMARYSYWGFYIQLRLVNACCGKLKIQADEFRFIQAKYSAPEIYSHWSQCNCILFIVSLELITAQ